LLIFHIVTSELACTDRAGCSPDIRLESSD
jgi:hypothetical protein